MKKNGNIIFFSISKQVCHHMSRGVLAIFGPTKQTSINTLNSVTDFYNIPYISWSFLDRAKSPLVKEQHVRRFRNSNCKSRVVDYGIFRNPRSIRKKSSNDLQDEYAADNILTNDFSDFTSEDTTSSQLYLRPNIYPVIIEILKHYKLINIYYIYNHEHGICIKFSNFNI